MTILYILLAVFVFGLLIFVHELGHFLFARLFGVKIFEFAIGMGPRIAWYRSKKTGIFYSLRAIPFGGFVSMAGELTDLEDENLPEEAKEVFPGDEKRGPLASKPAWQRLIVHVAGAAMNLLVGFVIVAVMTASLPANRLGTTQVTYFDPPVEGVPSSREQGLMIGDEIVKVGNVRVHIADELSYQILHQGGGDDPIVLTVLRDGNEIELPIVFPIMQESGQNFGSTDFYVGPVAEKTFGVVVEQAFYKALGNVTMVWDSLIDMITGRYTLEAVSGPIGTAGVITDAAKSGNAEYLFSLVALITINLGVFNLLPVPALDGAHILYTLIEMITRKKPPAKFIQVVDTVGLVLLLGLMVVITFQDVMRLF